MPDTAKNRVPCSTLRLSDAILETESEASSRYHREQRDARRQRREEDRQQQVAQQASEADEARRGQQCAESRRILNLKKARTDLTEGERSDLKRFEDAYLARCAR